MRNCFKLLLELVLYFQAQYWFPSRGMFIRWRLCCYQATEDRRSSHHSNSIRTASVWNRWPTKLHAPWCCVWLLTGQNDQCTRWGLWDKQSCHYDRCTSPCTNWVFSFWFRNTYWELGTSENLNRPKQNNVFLLAALSQNGVVQSFFSIFSLQK